MNSRARLADRHITLDLTDAAKEHIAREGYDPVYGARPLKRFLQRALETPLSRQLISGEVRDHTRVTVEFKKGELVFATKPGKRQDSASRLSQAQSSQLPVSQRASDEKGAHATIHSMKSISSQIATVSARPARKPTAGA